MTCNSSKDQNILLNAARSGDQKALSELIQIYEPEIRKVACKYFLPKSDHDDLIQEGRIAIYKAIIAYNAKSNIPFIHFLRMVIKRKLIDSLREHNRQKHVNFNDAYSLTDNNEETMLNAVSNFGDPETTIVALDEARDFVKNFCKELSELEYKVFRYHFIDGLKQREVHEKFGIDPKSLDNAIQRIRRKTMLFRSRQVAG